MNYTDFCQSLKTNLPLFFPENTYFNFSAGNTAENIGLLTIESPGDSMIPVFNLQDYFSFYLCGHSVDEICSRIGNLYARETGSTSFPIEALKELEPVRPHILLRLVGKAENRNLLERIPHRDLLNLAVIYELKFSGIPSFSGGILIDRELQKLWQLPEEELFELALSNTMQQAPYRFCSLMQMITELALLPPEAEGGPPVYVLTNQQSRYGAAVLLYPGLLESLEEEFGSFYLLPSSVHEWLMIPVSGKLPPKELKRTVREVNLTLLDSGEKLSDELYRYDKETGLKVC